MKSRIVSTEDFWKEMGKPSFVRLTKLTGMSMGELIITTQAPEDINNFIEEQIYRTMELLDPKYKLHENRDKLIA